MFSKSLAAVAAVLTVASGSPFLGHPQSMNVEASLEARQDLSGPYLHASAVAQGKAYFGTEIDLSAGEAKDTTYMKIFNNTQIFGAVTPANSMKMSTVQATQNNFNFAPGKQTITLAAQTGNKKVRCHNLIWGSQLPTWVSNPRTKWTNATLLAVMKNHITKTVQGFGSSCYSWDVVNEALNDDGSLNMNVWATYIGQQYLPLAFLYAQQAARAAKISPKLIYNDYNLENNGPKTASARLIVEYIQQWGIEIDGVGFESHFLVGQTPDLPTQMAAMQQITSLGPSIYQTELDVRFSSLPPTIGGLAQQAEDYYTTISACMQTPQCAGMTLWDFSDKYSWIPASFPGQGDATPYWANYTRKPAYTAIYQAIEGVNCTVCT